MLKNTYSFFKGWILVALILCILLANPIYEAWIANLWSIAYQDKLFLATTSTHMKPMTIKHYRADIWIAREHLDQQDYNNVIQLLENEVSEEDPFAIRLSAEARLALDDVDHALPLLMQTNDVDYVLRLARTYEEKKKLFIADEIYKTAHSINPEAAALPYYFFLLTTVKQPKNAENYLLNIINMFPNSKHITTWYLRMGDLCRSQNRWDESEAYNRQVLIKDHKNIQAHIGIGWILYHRDKNDLQAKNEFLFAIQIDPNQGYGYFALAQMMNIQKLYSQADEWYREALKRNPNDRWWWLDWANSARASGNFDASITLYNETMQRFPDWAPVYFEVALAYQSAKMYFEAIEAVELAVKNLTSPDIVYYNRAAEIYESAGINDKAVKYYEQVLSLDSHNNRAMDGLRRINAKTPRPNPTPSSH
jgi:tetratricopeptide (TPR) repeat protein